MDDYHEKLYGQIRESYGKVVYTYMTHIEMANLLMKKNRCLKMIQIILSSISTVGFLADVITNQVLLTWLAGISAALSLALNLYSKERNLTDEIRSNTETSNKLWIIREDYLSLLTDFPILTDEDIRRKRDLLETSVSEIYNNAPMTNGKAYALAQSDLKSKEYQFFSPDEIDNMLPERLRISK